MITVDEYFGKWASLKTPQLVANAEGLLARVNPLLQLAVAGGLDIPINPATRSHISGQTLGGIRPLDCAQGSRRSSHKQGRGVDVYDPLNRLDAWITDEILDKFGLYREAPSATLGWCHLTDRAPPSGRRTFNP